MKLDNAPLELELNEELELRLSGNVLKPDVRTVQQMLDVVKNKKEVTALPAQQPTYYMYRHVVRGEDNALFGKHKIRYDVTILPSLKLGSEYNKTHGHYHQMHDERLTFPELYEVLKGDAQYVLQERIVGNREKAAGGKGVVAEAEEGKVGRVFVVHAKAGDKVIVPPNFGHVTVNPSMHPLVMDNLVEAYFKSEYDAYKKRRGAAVYVTEKGIEENERYKGRIDGGMVIELYAKAFNLMVNAELARKLERKKSYELFLEEPELFRFLREPKEIELK